MKASFNRAIAWVLQSEGGYVNNKADPGGMTNRGITARTLGVWTHRRLASITKTTMLGITAAEASQLYYDHMWVPNGCDRIPAGLDYAVFDEIVNSGPGRAIKALQKILGVHQDGRFGPACVAALSRHRDVAALIRAFDAERLSFMHRLKTWRTFGRGWQSRVTTVTSRALLLHKAYA